MASITTEPNGRRSVQFIGADGKRRTIRLGIVTKSAASQLCARIEDLARSRISGTAPSRDTSLWLAERDSLFRAKLAAVGLIDEQTCPRIGEFIEDYLEERIDLRDSTRIVIGQAKRRLLAYFGTTRTLAVVSAADAAGFAAWLRTEEGLAENTARRTTGIARQLWKIARRRGLVTSDPFADLPVATGGNPSRQRLIDGTTIQNLIEATECPEWRLLLALARWSGVRVPSEPWALRWADIDWARKRMNVPEVKTARKTGRAFRTIPIFPEVEPYLQAAFDRAPDGAEFVFASLRSQSAQLLRKGMLQLIRRAGIPTAWPKLWHNLRASRATELADRFPAHVAAAWLGHSVAIAERHYLQLTESHFDAAIAPAPCSALQNPVQSGAASRRNTSQRLSATESKTPLLGSGAGSCDSERLVAVGAESNQWAILDLNRASQSVAATGGCVADDKVAVQNPVQSDSGGAYERVLALVNQLSDGDRARLLKAMGWLRDDPAVVRAST